MKKKITKAKGEYSNALMLRLADAGIGVSDLMAAFDISRQAVHRWAYSFIPTERALEIEKLSRGRVTAMQILKYARTWHKERDSRTATVPRRGVRRSTTAAATPVSVAKTKNIEQLAAEKRRQLGLNGGR